MQKKEFLEARVHLTARMHQGQLPSPDGRRLLFTAQGTGLLNRDAQEQAVA